MTVMMIGMKVVKVVVNHSKVKTFQKKKRVQVGKEIKRKPRTIFKRRVVNQMRIHSTIMTIIKRTTTSNSLQPNSSRRSLKWHPLRK